MNTFSNHLSFDFLRETIRYQGENKSKLAELNRWTFDGLTSPNRFFRPVTIKYFSSAAVGPVDSFSNTLATNTNMLCSMQKPRTLVQERRQNDHGRKWMKTGDLQAHLHVVVWRSILQHDSLVNCNFFLLTVPSVHCTPSWAGQQKAPQLAEGHTTEQWDTFTSAVPPSKQVSRQVSLPAQCCSACGKHSLGSIW